MEGGIKVISIDRSSINQLMVRRYFVMYIKGPMYSLDLKISAAKQHCPCQADAYFPFAGFLLSAYLGK